MRPVCSSFFTAPTESGPSCSSEPLPILHASFILPTRPLPRPRNGPSGFRLKTPLDLAMERTPALLQTLSTRYGRLRLRLISIVGQVEVSVHLWMNESENACDKHHHRNAQQGNGEPLYVASRCLFGRWLAHASFLILCLAPPT